MPNAGVPACLSHFKPVTWGWLFSWTWFSASAYSFASPQIIFCCGQCFCTSRNCLENRKSIHICCYLVKWSLLWVQAARSKSRKVLQKRTKKEWQLLVSCLPFLQKLTLRWTDVYSTLKVLLILSRHPCQPQAQVAAKCICSFSCAALAFTSAPSVFSKSAPANTPSGLHLRRATQSCKLDYSSSSKRFNYPTHTYLNKPEMYPCGRQIPEH